MSDQPVARPLHRHRINAHTHIVAFWLGFEPTIPVFEQAKTVHGSDRAAIVFGNYLAH
jgi:hypothetical protein